MRKVVGGFFGFIFSGLNLLVLSIFVLAFLAKFFRPEIFWPGALLANFLPVIGLGLLFFWILSIKRKRPSWILWNTIAIAACCFRMSPVFLNSANSESSVNDLKVFTQNVPRTPEDNDAREAMLRSVAPERPEILAFQESGVFSTVADPSKGRVQRKLRILTDSLGYSAPPATRLDDSGRWYNIQQPILSSLPFEDQVETIYRHNEKDYDPLHMTRTVVKWQGRDIAIYNVHLRTFGPNKPWYHPEIRWWDIEFWKPFVFQIEDAYSTRSWQVDQILNVTQDERLPFLLLGDFNSTPYGWVYSKFQERYTDVFGASTRGFGHTYHVSLPLLRIDHVFASDHWIPVSAEVGYSDRLVSDHRPLLARVRLKE